MTFVSSSGNRTALQSRFRYQRILARNREGSLILSILTLFFFYVIGTPVYIIYTRSTSFVIENAGNMNSVRTYMAQKVFQTFYLGIPAVLLVTFLAVFNGIQVFSYQFSKQELDFYQSLPVRKSTRFWQRYLSGFLFFLIPFLCCFVLSSLIAAGMNSLNTQTGWAVLYGAFRMVIYYLGIYSLSILSTMLTGKLIYALLMCAYMTLAELGASVLLALLRSMYFLTYYAKNDAWFEQYKLYSSPIFSFFLGRHRMKDLITPDGIVKSGLRMVRADLPSTMWILFLAVVFTGLAALAYRYRKTESAGTSLIFQPIRILVKISCGVMGGAFLAVILDSVLNNVSHILSTAAVLPITAAGCLGFLLLFDAITRVNIRASLQRIGYILTACGLSILLVSCFRWDVLGYDRYVPDPDSVKTAGLYLLSAGDRRSMEGTTLKQNMTLTDIRDVERIARIGQKHLCDTADGNVASFRFGQGTDYQVSHALADEKNYYDTANGFDALVIYQMKSGKSVYRKMCIPYTIDSSVMDPVLSSEAYQASWFRLTEASQLPSQTNLSLAYDSGYTSRSVAETDGLMEEFIHAYSSDLMQYSYTFVKQNDPIGTVRWTTDTSEFNYEVYPSYTNTIAFLRKYDLYLPGVPPERMVRKLTLVKVTHQKNGKDTEDELGTITDTDTIEEVLKSDLYNSKVLADWKDNFSLQSQGWQTSASGERVSYRLRGALNSDEEGTESISYTFEGTPSETVLQAFSIH